MSFKNGTSTFKYSILNDIVELDVRIEWDEYGEATIDEVLIEGYDLTEEILSYGLSDKLEAYAVDNGHFTSDKE